MATQKKKSGRLKALLGAIAGLFSGATLMYLSPLVDRVIRPTPPIANFEARTEGLTVTFHNLSTGGRSLEGWWDFGDGSPLVPLVPDQDIHHTYPAPGAYTARLSVRNLLGESNERTVTLQLATGENGAPRIVQLEAQPITALPQAPATFRVASEVRNAQLLAWDLDGDRPLEVISASPGRQERLVTFEKPGRYTIKLAAFAGQQQEQKTVQVSVQPPPAGSLTAVLHVTDQATVVERHDRPSFFGASFPPDERGDVHRVAPTFTASQGWSIADVIVPKSRSESLAMQGKSLLPLDAQALKAGPVRNLKLEREPGGRSVKLTGELVRASKKERPAMMLPVVLREERRQPITRLAPPVMAALTVPGSTQLMLPPLPPDWETPRRQVRFELRDGERIIWKGNELPAGVNCAVRGRRCVLTAAQSGDRVQVVLKELSIFNR